EAVPSAPKDAAPDDGGEPTIEQVQAGATRPAKFDPLMLLGSEIMSQGRHYFVRIATDESLLQVLDASKRAAVPFVQYKKLELPRAPGTAKEAAIPLSAQCDYDDYEVPESHVENVAKEITRSDYNGTSKTHTDVIMKPAYDD